MILLSCQSRFLPNTLPFISVRSPKDIENDETSFSSEMCHQVFGDNENIFGYTDLHIKLYYTAGSLQTYLGIEYTDKVWYPNSFYPVTS